MRFPSFCRFILPTKSCVRRSIYDTPLKPPIAKGDQVAFLAGHQQQRVDQRNSALCCRGHRTWRDHAPWSRFAVPSGLRLVALTWPALRPDSTRGRFITFEGGEGTGKSTQAKVAGRAALDRLRAVAVVETREPGGSPFAERVRDLLLDPCHASRMRRWLRPCSSRRHAQIIVAATMLAGFASR